MTSNNNHKDDRDKNSFRGGVQQLQKPPPSNGPTAAAAAAVADKTTGQQQPHDHQQRHESKHKPHKHYSESFRKQVYKGIGKFAHPDEFAFYRDLMIVLTMTPLALWLLRYNSYYHYDNDYYDLEDTNLVTRPRIILRLIGCFVLIFFLSSLQAKAFNMTHDLLHGSALGNKKLCRLLGHITGIVCNVSPSVWIREHTRHHHDSNNLNKSQDGQGASWTRQQLDAAPLWAKLLYGIINHPFFLITIVPLGYFFGFMRIKAQIHENILAAAFYYELYKSNFLAIYIVSFWFTGMFGFMVFHAQHVFDGCYKRSGAAKESWDMFDNAMLGSSLLFFPQFGGPLLESYLQWVYHGVGYHHIHHLNTKIPGYRLADAHNANLELMVDVPIVHLGQNLHYSIYNENAEKFESISLWQMLEWIITAIMTAATSKA